MMNELTFFQLLGTLFQAKPVKTIAWHILVAGLAAITALALRW